ncbi:MAG: hypothetical protein ACR2P4_05130 [Gammaproteobacteria bacterium]
MSLPIETFSNRAGGFTYFKALGHPLVADSAAALVGKIRAAKCAAVYDPLGQLPAFAALHGLSRDDYQSLYWRDALQLCADDCAALCITGLPKSGADLLFIPAFDAAPLLAQVRHLLPEGCAVMTLDEMRIPPRLLTDKRNYLNKLNFATNFAFFRDQDEKGEKGGRHTRITTANYWGGYGAKDTFLWCRLFGEDGAVLADFEMPLGPANGIVTIDSRKVRAAHSLPPFCGQLFISVVNGAGHDIVKYVIDTIGDDDGESSCTHDANAWPADLYAGLPAPAEGEKVILWVQNSHPAPIPANEIGLNVMGAEDTARYLDETIAPFASCALDVAGLLPEVKWPQQLEIRAGKWFVRPRYEATTKSGRRRINHPNVERTDLSHDEQIRRAASFIGKGFILPAPILPLADFDTIALPTPMSSAQTSLPIEVILYGANGEEKTREKLGVMPRDNCRELAVGRMLRDAAKGEQYGHAELVYDMDADGVMDGWLHSLFRYADSDSGHIADTSFGAHLFNHSVVFRNEPQSYKGPPPGLSTRLFLRLMPHPARVFCHLIYPVSAKWHAKSTSRLELKNAAGEDIAAHDFAISASGSFFFFVDDVFGEADLHTAGEDGYILVRDQTCRLFGYHGWRQGGGFAFDHMFGF